MKPLANVTYLNTALVNKSFVPMISSSVTLKSVTTQKLIVIKAHVVLTMTSARFSGDLQEHHRINAMIKIQMEVDMEIAATTE